MPVPALIDEFLAADLPVKIVSVVFIIIILFFISVFIALTVAARSEPLAIKGAPDMMPMYQRVARYWQ